MTNMLKSMTSTKSVDANVLENTGAVFITITRKIRVMILRDQIDFSVRDLLHQDVYTTVEDGGQELELVKISDFTTRIDSVLGSKISEEQRNSFTQVFEKDQSKHGGLAAYNDLC